jgi:hypothetical protein
MGPGSTVALLGLSGGTKPTVVVAVPVVTVVAVVIALSGVAVSVIAVPCWIGHTAYEQGGEDRKNENVFHIGSSFKNDRFDKSSAHGPRKMPEDRGPQCAPFEHPPIALVRAASYIADRRFNHTTPQIGRPIPLGSDPLVLTADEAASLVSLACQLPSLGSAVGSNQASKVFGVTGIMLPAKQHVKSSTGAMRVANSLRNSTNK